ncbi:GDSL family lipase [Pseudoclavibacter sp. AY1F1]|uniref:SGNH/GDSL hydrolase family protein n=1 Tax=Pseudoclavibacter sp. AY1F1 TaxID=2080583 RepID=UPI000CE8C65E|nr:SGNH/GDSL hydrolase family protein [Pseudoclavibacter sp. AY1F1]PPF44754.1 GDSL family lipase [Pseudoclavibacter sp. AY1F1]
MGFTSFAAVGDSFTEGVGDELPGGQVRGWADLVAQGLAVSSPEPVTYANLAIRGRLLDAILEEQLPAAIALKPQLLSLNGGGNDILRPRVSIDAVAQRLVDGAKQALDAGIHVILLSGANPSDHLPMGKRISARGDALAAAVHAKIPAQPGLTFVDNWADPELRHLDYWSRDRLHMGASGHQRVAANVLTALEVPAPDFGPQASSIQRPRNSAYWREYVLPWIGRRLTGRSSGDTRTAKYPTLERVVTE